MFEAKVRKILEDQGWEPIGGMKHCWKREETMPDGTKALQGYLAAFVDDFLAVGINTPAQKLLETIAEGGLKINIETNTQTTSFIGSKLLRRDGHIIQSQEEYTSALSANPNRKEATPLPYRINEVQDVSKRLPSNQHKEFRRKLGRILFIARDSRPDLAYAASFLGKYAQGATTQAAHLAERAIAYAKNHPLTIPLPNQPYNDGTLRISAFVDASMGSEANAYGTTGWIILCQGKPLLWKAKRQQRVARSSLKAELIALDDIVDNL